MRREIIAGQEADQERQIRAFWQTNAWVPHHDNALAHMALSCRRRREPILLASIQSKWLERFQKMPSMSVLNLGKGACAGALDWKVMILRQFDFATLEIF